MLLPGASRLARLVGTVREAANSRLWDILFGLLSTGQQAVLDSLLFVPSGARVSDRKIFHGRSGRLYQRYQDGMEDQIGALGLVLNALVLFNTRYMDAAVNQLLADGFDVRNEDVARPSPFVRHHINTLGRNSFQLPELPGGMRPLRDPDATEDE